MKRDRHPTPAERAAILAAYLRGDKLVAISAQFNVSNAYPVMLAHRLGVPLRGRVLRNQQGGRHEVTANKAREIA